MSRFTEWLNAQWPKLAVAVLVLLVSCGGGSPTTPSPQPSPPASPGHAVRGTVRDSGNLNLLAAVTVRLTADSQVREVTTGFEGEFSFAGVLGDGSLTATAAGYEASTLATSAATSSLDVRLRRVVGRSVACGQAPDTGNRVLPMFSRPFDGDFPLTNYFDHDLPTGSYSGSGEQLTFCGERVGGRLDAHQGYDWLLPTGTPLLAVADGTVTHVGTDPPFFCGPLGRTVSDQRFVEIRHAPMNGEQFSSVFVHLSQSDVGAGQTVSRGQRVGLSGNTGCSTEPHVHLQVWRLTGTTPGRPVLVDPYGWEGAGLDPWAEHPSGAGSIWLWRPGGAPALGPR